VAAILAVVLLPRTPAAEGDGDRVKGAAAGHPALAVYRRTAGGSERLADGDAARKGDLLRVGYVSGGRAYGMILSIDGRGTVTMHLPVSGDRAVPLAHGKTIFLDDAFELDDAPRAERFYFITGVEPFAVSPIVAGARRATPGSPPALLHLGPGLDQTTFAIQKEGRP
jgi:hypothetical protein